MIEGAAILLGGWVLGWLSRRVVKRVPKPPSPICGCTHHLALHDETGCHGSRNWEVKWAVDRYENTYPVAWEARPCACRKYVLKNDPYAGVLGP